LSERWRPLVPHAPHASAPHASVVRTFSTVLKARCARRASVAADPRRRRAPKARPGRGAAARTHGSVPELGVLPFAGRRPPLKALRATAATAHVPDPARPTRPGPRRPPPVLAARAREEVASSRRPSLEPRKITLKGALRASHAMAQAPPLTMIFHESLGTYRKDDPGWTAGMIVDGHYAPSTTVCLIRADDCWFAPVEYR
jgi:hypothetical protein